MSTRLRDVLMHELGALRHEPTDKRIRAVLGGETVIDSRRALLVWEPKRIVPSYAVPAEDVRGEISPSPDGDGLAAAGPGLPGTGVPHLGERPVLDPSVPFAVHTVRGKPLAIRTSGSDRAAAAFRPADPDLGGHLIVDFGGMDAWYEEDEPNVGHPRDPFHRIDIVPSSRTVRIELDGQALAESSRPLLLFEPPLPVRAYLDPADVRMNLLVPSETRSTCAYKGHASYWSLQELPDVAWTYPEPRREAAEVAGKFAFFNERVDVLLDGERQARPVTPWSRR